MIMVADAETLGLEAPGVDAAGVDAAGVDAAGVEAPDAEAAGVEPTGVASPGVPPGVVPGVAGMTTTGAKAGLSATAGGSRRGVDVAKRASRIRYGLL